jgi:putative PEP-CTERM system TPR-repeat lipoprotein
MGMTKDSFARTLTAGATVLLLSTLWGCNLFVSDASRLERAIQLKSQGDFNAASIELRKLVERDAGHARAWFLLGETSLYTGLPIAAEGQLRRALELGIPRSEVMVPLGKALIEQAQFERTLQELGPAEVQDPNARVEVLKLRGDAYLGLARYADAERAYLEVLAVHTGSLDARVGMARVAQQKGDLEAAEKYVADVLGRDPGYAAGWLARGFLDLQLRRYGGAEEAFSRALSAATASGADEFAAIHGLAESQWHQGKTDEALTSTQRLLDLAPHHPQPKYLRAAIAYGAADYSTAKDYLQQTLRVAPGHQPAALLLGATHYAQGELEQAYMYLNSALTTAPSSVSTRKLLAATRLRQQRPKDAVSALAPIAADTGDSSVLALMGEANLQAGDRAAGLLYFERALAANPGDRPLKMQLATAYVTTGNFEHAIDLLTQMPETEAGASGRDLLLVLAYLRKGEGRIALQQARDFAVRRPADPAAHSLLGSVYMTLGEKDNARAHFEKALQLRPDNSAVLIHLGRLALLEGKQDEARSRFERVVTLRSNNTEAMLALAHLAASSNDKAGVEQWLLRANETDPQAVEPALLLIRQSLESGQRDRARNVARGLVTAKPSDAAAQNALGIVHSADGAFEQAVISFRKAVAAVPDSANYTYNLARAELAVQRRAEAKRLLKRALELQPGHRGALATVAALEMQDGEAKQALGRVRALQEDKHTAAAGLMLEGDLRMLQREFDEAANAYDAALKRAPSRLLALRSYEARKRAGLPNPAKPLDQWLTKNPGDVSARLVIALDFQQQGKLDQAASEYEQILTKRPDDPLALNNLAWVYSALKDSRAIPTAERAHALEPNNGAITDTLGWLLVQKGEVERGRGLLEKAVQQAPDIPDIRYHLAVALARAGAREEARKTLIALLGSGQDFGDASDARRLLEEL